MKTTLVKRSRKYEVATFIVILIGLGMILFVVDGSPTHRHAVEAELIGLPVFLVGIVMWLLGSIEVERKDRGDKAMR
jgi:hypothetical protein